MRVHLSILWISLISVVLLTSCGGYEGQSAEEWADEYYACEDTLEDYEDALEEANSRIEELNGAIQDAQWYTWETYEEMGYALESILYTLDPVDEP